MNYFALLIAALLFSQLSIAQPSNAWVRFTDTANELCGYKDLNGNITIPPRFQTLTRADTFYNIIAVNEKIDKSLNFYYLLRDGRKIGRDSVFMFELAFDCESEGKILFADQKKDRVGFLDKNGQVVIPAIYNSASPFHNGVALALRNAKRKRLNGRDTSNSEHLGWAEGETVLINDKNEILVDNVQVNLNSINWYSKRINDPSADTSIFINIKGVNNIIYSFVDYKKEFTKWFHTAFLTAINSKNSINLAGLFFTDVTFWSKNNGWIKVNKNKFMSVFPGALSPERFQESMMMHISIGQEDINDWIFGEDLYNRFYNSCGQRNKEKYPLFNVVLTHYKKRSHPISSGTNPSELLNENEINYQEIIEFIRTEIGYKLLSIAVKK